MIDYTEVMPTGQPDRVHRTPRDSTKSKNQIRTPKTRPGQYQFLSPSCPQNFRTSIPLFWRQFIQGSLVLSIEKGK